MGVVAFAESLLVIPKVYNMYIINQTLIENCGYDVQEVILDLIHQEKATNAPVGVNILKNEIMSPVLLGVYDNYVMKKQWLHIAPTLA